MPKTNVNTKKEDIKKFNTVYDELPYDSYPHAVSNLYHLVMLGTLFGMSPPPLENARVLELGCAGGRNIIPYAVNFPNASFVGIDLSKVQLDSAIKEAEELELDNIKFHHLSIAEIDEKFGKFDYVICHGVFSWVPNDIQDKILAVCHDNLSPNGIAYVSYNTLPGWNMVRTIRDMMLHHSTMFQNVADKVTQSRLLLNFVKDSLSNSDSPYAKMLSAEAELLSKQSDYYLRHDHLGEVNTQYYFQEFMDKAKNHKLQYLADSSLPSMYLGNMPSKVIETLQSLNDIVRTEQYMDYITNRRFRTTLLCHNDVKLNRNINNNDITKFNMIFNVVPEKPLNEVDLNNSTENLKFFFNGNRETNLSTPSAPMKALLYAFSENLNNPMSFNKACEVANQKLGGKKLEEVKNELQNNAMRLVLQGYLTITLLNERKKTNLEKPKANKLALYQATKSQNNWVTNLKHEPIGIDAFEKILVKYMDGENTKDNIVENIMLLIKSGEINVSKNGNKVENDDEIKSEVTQSLNKTIEKMAQNAVLV